MNQPNAEKPHLAPARWGMVTLCFFGTVINYMDRANLGLAMPIMQREFGFNSTTAGLILGGFFWSYAVIQLPAGWLVDRFGPKLVYTLAAGWWSVFTMATSLARGALSLLGCRVLLGIGEAGAYPSDAKVTALWFPRSERAFASSLYDSGSRVGATLSWPVIGFLIAYWGWRASFVVTGLLGIAWIGMWQRFYRDPTAREQLVVQQRNGPLEIQAKMDVSWTGLFRYRTIWGMCLGFFCLNFVIYFFITWFPSYLLNARGYSALRMGSVGAMPAVCAVLGGWIGGYSSDAIYRTGWSLNAARKICIVGGMLLSSSIALAAVVHSQAGALALFCLSYASLAFSGASVWSLPADVAPTQAQVASIAGIQNFAASIAGILTATFTGAMLTMTHGSFVIPLVIGGGVCILGALSYLFVVGRIEPLGRFARPSDSE
jgi:MFS family permease